MKKNNFKISFAVLILAVLQMGHLTSCQDDMAADSYYTFTGETMSDFLDNNPNFSLFNQIVERAGRKAFLSSRGTRTLFPAVNEGVQAFLDENGYRSVEDITPDYCDILVKTAIVENFSIYDFTLTDKDMETISGMDTGKSPIYDDMDLTTTKYIGTHKIHD